MSDEALIEDQQVGSSRDAIELRDSVQHADAALNDIEQMQTSTEHNDLEMGTSSGRFTPVGFKNNTVRRIKAIGRHFNVLDRLFKKTSQQTSHLQQGASFDGVFSNLSAKPDGDKSNQITKEDNPPTYDEAAVDMAPSYYGVDDDGSGMYYNEICIEGLPVGNVANLAWNIVVSTSFQFIGFLITYILHTSHAAKQGSRFGLGLTFLGYAYSMIPNDVKSKVGKENSLSRVKLSDPNEFDDLHLYSHATSEDDFTSTLSSGTNEEKQSLPILAVLIGLFGVFITAKSIYDYVQVKKMERRYISQE